MARLRLRKGARMRLGPDVAKQHRGRRGREHVEGVLRGKLSQDLQDAQLALGRGVVAHFAVPSERGGQSHDRVKGLMPPTPPSVRREEASGGPTQCKAARRVPLLGPGALDIALAVERGQLGLGPPPGQSRRGRECLYLADISAPRFAEW